ncbi:hypothetical protein [Actinomadura craniellae]|uniref:hypothetical protein n=1 Tax=Actinomadura craniellae TaxID=2231787 RepID=UPI0011BFB594|nr:hypothetical protein [Actinomadura craniellae]
MLINAGNVLISGSLQVATGLEPDDIGEMVRTYIPVDGWDTALRLLRHQRHTRTVALVGEPGSGRHITAVNLAVELGLTPRHALADPEMKDRTPTLEDRKLVMQAGDACILSLDPAGDVPRDQVRRYVQRRLSELPPGAVLILRVSPELWEVLGLSIPEVLIVPTDQPLSVYKLQVQEEVEWNYGERWWLDQRLLDRVASVSPAEACRLARAVRARSTSSLAPAELIDQILAISKDWSSDIKGFFRDTERLDTPHKRALLIAVAAVGHGSVEQIFSARDELLRVLKVRNRPGEALLGPGRFGQLQDLKAKSDDDETFYLEPGKGAALLRHVWKDFGDVRKPISSWLRKIATPDNLNPAYSYMELALGVGDLAMVREAAEEWAAEPRFRQLAIDLLSVAALDERLGRQVRDLLYQWATQPTKHRAELVALVCAGPLGHTVTDIALTRLRRLATHLAEETIGLVVDALLSLALEPKLRVPITDELVRWLKDDRLAHAAARALSVMAQEGVMVPDASAGRADAERIVEVFRVVLLQKDGELAFLPWFAEVAAGHSSEELFLDVVDRLLQFGEGKGPVAMFLHLAPQHAQSDDPSSQVTVLLEKLRQLLYKRAPQVARIQGIFRTTEVQA